MTRTPLCIASWPADGRRWSLWPTAASRCSSFCTWRRTRPSAAKARRRWSWCCPCSVPCHPLHLRITIFFSPLLRYCREAPLRVGFFRRRTAVPLHLRQPPAGRQALRTQTLTSPALSFEKVCSSVSCISASQCCTHLHFCVG